MRLAPASGGGYRILIVDDEQSILFAVRDYFGAHGLAVDCAQDVEEARGFMERNPYGVVIADLRLTGIGDTQGLDLVRCVRRRWPATRIIILTAYGSPAIEAEARRQGVDAFLNKPMPLPAVARIVVDLLGMPPASGPRPPSPSTTP